MLYVYAITATDAAALDELPAQEGILPGVPVRRVAAAASGELTLAAIVSDVPPTIFGSEALRAHLDDADWTRARILAHQRVVASLLPLATVLPLKFGTLFAQEATLTALLADRRPALEAAAAQVRGAREWGVKLFFAPSPSPAAVPSGELVGAGAGVAFFRRKKSEQEARAAKEALRDDGVAASHRRLSAHARASIANPLQPPEAHGQSGIMGLNGAYLVATEDEPAWRAALTELEQTYAALGARYVLTGPWAPYHFAGGGLV